MSHRPVHPLLLLRSCLVVGAITASGCVDAPATAPRFVATDGASAAKQTPTSSKILIQKDGGNNPVQVYTMSDDGSQVLQVTTFYGATQASWAPDGKRILFIGRLNSATLEDIGSINSDGTGVTFFHLESLCPTWPVALGKDVMFIDGCNNVLYRMHADGTGLTPLLTGLCPGQPSPDAQAKNVAVCRGWDIVLLNVETGAVTNITNTPTVNEDEPAFSPNGKQIAFRRTTNQIWLMNADGTNATMVAADAFMPHWSPDGKRIAFSRYESGNFEVFTMAANGSGVTNLTRTPNNSEWATAWISY